MTQSSHSKESKESWELIAPLRYAKESEDVCFFSSMFHSFRINADINIKKK